MAEQLQREKTVTFDATEVRLLRMCLRLHLNELKHDRQTSIPEHFGKEIRAVVALLEKTEGV